MTDKSIQTVITPKNNTQEKDSHASQRLFSKSYIQKFSNSWKYFAKANDIAKREKLKKALTDALHSMDHRRRDEVLTTIDSRTVQRIKHAASLLKQFKQMYTLSENVKRTLLTYNDAKKSLTDIAHSKEGLDILKRFLQKHTTQRKRDEIPLHPSNFASLVDQAVSDTVDDDSADFQLVKPQYITKTDKISLKAALISQTGKIGMEFASVDSRTSSISKAERAFKAAKILMRYIALEKDKKKPNSEKMSALLSSLNSHIADNTKISNLKKSDFPTPRAHADVTNDAMTYINHNSTAENQPDSVMEKLITDEDSQNTKGAVKSVVAKQNKVSDSTSKVTAPDSPEKSKKRSNPYVALLKKILKHRNETLEANKNNEKKDVTEKWTNGTKNDAETVTTDDKPAEVGNKTETIVLGSGNANTSTAGNNEEVKNTNDDDKAKTDTENKSNTTETNDDSNSQVKSLENVLTLKKQQDAVERLQEAKLARQKYEIAKHELAEKVKELYVLANDYEKQETSDQILEVKNFIQSTPEFEASAQNVKRDDSHPGVALSGIHSKKVSKISTDDANDGKHKGFTMGMIDKKEHQIELEDPKLNEEVKKVYDVGLPSTVKLNDLSGNKKTKSQEETLKVIAQAIQEDMADISNNEKQKKKLLEAALPAGITPLSNSTHDKGEKKGGPPADKIDEYLTNALADIMGNESKADSADASKDGGKEGSKGSQEDRNRKIVEKAMAQHASNPSVNLPLVETKGDKVVLNKDQNGNKSKTAEPKKSNDVFAHASDRDTSNKNTGSNLDVNDPENKALLDKATHMEEQVAAAQDKLYSSETSREPPVAAPNTEYVPPPMKQYEPARYQHTHSFSDPYGSINERPQNAPLPQQEPPQEYEGPEEGPEREEGPEYDDEEEEPQRRHHRHKYHEAPDDDEEEDDDRDDDDDDEKDDDEEPDDYKKSRVGYRDDQARKRTLPSSKSFNMSTAIETSKLTNKHSSGADVAEDKQHIEELEDSKKSFVPGSVTSGRS